MTAEQILAFACSVEGQGTEDHQNCTYTSAELRLLVEHTLALPPRSCVVEIGVYGGRSASVFLQAQPEKDLDIHLIDNWSWDQKRATDTFVAMILQYFNEVPFTLHKMLSTRKAEYWWAWIDFLHIDGWHDLDGVEPDCRKWIPWLKPNACVAFHDSDCEPVKFCINKYVKEKGFALVGEAGRTTVWRRP